VAVESKLSGTSLELVAAALEEAALEAAALEVSAALEVVVLVEAFALEVVAVELVLLAAVEEVLLPPQDASERTAKAESNNIIDFFIFSNPFKKLALF